MEKSAQNKTLILLGMHRSGTSLIAHWLQNCGLQIGAELLGPGHSNVEGHFEDVEFYNIHREILENNNLDESGVIFNSVNSISVINKAKIEQLIQSKNRLFEQWGWKDPRTCLFLDFYREILPDAYYLIIIRDYKCVVISLIKRMMRELDSLYNSPQKKFLSKIAWRLRRARVMRKISREQADYFLKVWIFYNEKILENISALSPEKYLVIDYEYLKEKDFEVATVLNKKWNFSVHYSKFADVLNESLFSKPFNLDAYVSDKQLIVKANNLGKRLKCYFPDEN